MKKIFDEHGNEVPHEEFAIIAYQAIEKVRRENKERLIKQIVALVTKAGCEFTAVDAQTIIIAVKNHDANYINL